MRFAPVLVGMTLAVAAAPSFGQERLPAMNNEDIYETPSIRAADIYDAPSVPSLSVPGATPAPPTAPPSLEVPSSAPTPAPGPAPLRERFGRDSFHVDSPGRLEVSPPTNWFPSRP